MPDASDLSVVVTDANGASTRWGSEDLDAGTIPRGVTFRTQRMGGFADGSLQLSRRIDGDNVDVRLLDDLALIGGDGTVAYEGYVSALPRSFATEHTLDVQATGWVGHAMDRPLTDVIVDRDLSRWGGASTLRRANLLGYGYGQVTDPTIVPDQSGASAVRVAVSGAWLAATPPVAQAFYDAGPGNLIGSIYYAWTKGIKINAGDPSWDWRVVLSTDDVLSAFDITANLLGNGPGAGTLVASQSRRFAVLALNYALSVAGGVDGTEYNIDWSNVTVYGNHGLPLLPAINAPDPKGVAASDVIRYLAAKYAPLLNTTAIGQTTYPIPHLVWRDETKPWDAMLDTNAFHLWNLAVWEDRTLTYTPPDLTDYDWEIRTDDPGTTITLQGDNATELANGIRVQYTNVTTGRADILSPDTYTELRDQTVENPATRHGRKLWPTHQVTSPTTLDGALQIGRAALAEYNQPKAAGQITKTHYIRDRAGHLQPVWKVRGGDRVSITSSAAYSDRPRTIQDTSYDHSSRSLSIGVDSTLNRLEGIAHRTEVALRSANL